MPTAAFYRDEAESQRKLAAVEQDPMLKAQLLGFARDYDTLAEIVQAAEAPDAPLPPTGSLQRQPMQQQQQQTKKEEGT
jgi:hypothetical protein